ncbi:hypothetical protein QTL95_24050 [Rhizobium sp. S152]|uniref:hypothetical protein n=1 Tax=Rhizobium sp. S152 TaxID=3055038 RepID=UPI0025A97040|nr:hypothetical protein [Rhizobium sp. S152]MDM9628976.1 hypothetical protein [Rhizobium sp. S152]
MQLIDPNHPAYRPLWVRILIVGVCLGWSVLEFTKGDPFWGVLSCGAGVYAAYMLFWNYKPLDPSALPETAVEDDANDAADEAGKPKPKD